MDDIDKQIVNLLTLNGRTSNAELARKIGLSAPSVAERNQETPFRPVCAPPNPIRSRNRRKDECGCRDPEPCHPENAYRRKEQYGKGRP